MRSFNGIFLTDYYLDVSLIVVLSQCETEQSSAV